MEVDLDSWVVRTGLEEAGIVQLLRMMDWMMTLPSDLKRQFRDELDIYEEERKMPLLTSTEQDAIEENTRKIALKLLELGVEVEVIAQGCGLTPEQIESFRSGSSD